MANHVDEDFATRPVTLDERCSVLSIILVLVGAPICVPALFAGATLSKVFDLQQGIYVLAIGGIILSILGGLMGTLGVRTGLSTGMLVKETFGSLGGKFVNLAIAVTLFGWYAVQTGFFGQTVSSMWPGIGFLASKTVASLWGGALMMLSAYFGFKGVKILSYVAVPLVAMLCVWGVLRTVANVDVVGFKPPESGSLGQGVTMIVGTFAVGAVVMPDITRYARSVSANWTASLIGFLVVNGLVYLSGMMTAMATGSGDLTGSMLALGMGLPAILVLVFGQWTTNDDNLYSGSLCITGSFPSVSKKKVVLAGGIIATIVGAAGFADAFIPFLTVLGVLIPPVGGILVADHFGGGVCENRMPVSGRVQFIALVAWAIGSAVGFLFEQGIPAVNAIVVSAVVFLVLKRFVTQRRKDLVSASV